MLIKLSACLGEGTWERHESSDGHVSGVNQGVAPRFITDRGDCDR